jgi:hypothetical protein
MNEGSADDELRLMRQSPTLFDLRMNSREQKGFVLTRREILGWMNALHESVNPAS